MYAPWIRKIWLVTDGECPKWLSTDDPHISLVNHTEIFAEEDLPVYNNNAIENNVYKIQGLSNQYLYFGENMVLKERVCPDEFINDDGYIFHANGLQSNQNEKCPVDCTGDLFGNNECDEKCNQLGCLWDGLDCEQSDQIYSIEHAQNFVGNLFEMKLIKDVDRYQVPNVPFLVDKEIMQDLHNYFNSFYHISKKRSNTDLPLPITYVNWVLQAPLGASD